ncbi:olfactory receptor 56-like [Octodon degus]|uniref:Olfactory receptor n=1 Tax=Octodon degus TaxID=10160 RepID=A0A6P3VCR5_OCTDE|nr:olfactory receptor 56-like [Octodon degus]
MTVNGNVAPQGGNGAATGTQREEGLLHCLRKGQAPRDGGGQRQGARSVFRRKRYQPLPDLGHFSHLFGCLSSRPWRIAVLVPAICLVHTAACAGNALLIPLIWLDSQLHTPTYLLLGQLSVMDLTLASSIIPKMLADLFSGRRSISLLACGAQIFFSLTIAIAECILITFMCFDRYVAICNPLRYAAIVSPRVCLQMAAAAWAGGALTSLGHTAFTLHLHVCSPREIPHFFCEVMAVLRIACEDISAYEKAVVVTSILVLLLPLSLILSSYVVIFLTVLRMRSPEARSKALATCSSHLCVVGLYFGPGMFIYMRPGSAKTPKLNQGLFLFGTVLTPFLNPLAYSFRNKEVLGSLRKMVSQCRDRIIIVS